MTQLDPKYIPAADLDKNGVPTWHGNWETFHKYYKDKNYICKTCELPDKAVLAETGFRIGYGAHAFLEAQPLAAKYLAYDLDQCEFGVSALKSRFSKVDVQLFVGNSMQVEELPEPVDFFHVDGAHCYNGCMHDLILALKSLKSGGYLLIDDYKLNIRSCKVRKAVDDFLAMRRGEFSFVQYFDTWRGDYLMRKA